MRDAGELLGYAALSLKKPAVLVHKFVLEGYDFKSIPDLEQGFVLDSLMRASASYGETNGMTEVILELEDIGDFFKSRGFEEDNSRLITPMETIVKYK